MATVKAKSKQGTAKENPLLPKDNKAVKAISKEKI